MKETKISTGSYELNKWLYGGYDRDVITTIYGPPGSGKTNFCLIAMASAVKKGNKVLFIDTEGGFSIDRFRQLTDENYKNLLKNIIFLRPIDFQEQYKSFGTLLKEIKLTKISLVIIDSITMLYRLELAEQKDDKNKIKDVNSTLARQMRILAEIARKREIPVIITNQVYTDFLTEEERQQGKIAEIKMVGGDILKYWSKCLIELKLEKGKRKAILRKHRSLKEKELSFEIVNNGIVKRGLF